MRVFTGTEHAPTFDSYDEAMRAFNSAFCYVVRENVIVRLSDGWIFKPRPFAARQFCNWRYVSDSFSWNAAKAWLKYVNRNQCDRLEDLGKLVTKNQVAIFLTPKETKDHD